jgi:transposase, IS5 family
MRAKVAEAEQPFRIVKRQFGHVKLRYRGLKKNTAQPTMLFALSNLWISRETLLTLDGKVRLKAAIGR